MATIVELVARLGRHERLTRGHTERVRAYADTIAVELGLSESDRYLLQWSCLLHDIGKLAVAPEILNKNGKPTDEEWMSLRRHPEVGGEIVEPLA
jgi:HD-GYP domain-containing protein (c-di-GMP phosphodiesterase class II)